MTREILFRGFHKDENGSETIYIDGQPIKGKWVYGYLVEYTYKDIIYMNGTSPKTSYIFPMGERSQLKCLQSYIEVIPRTIGQYIGLDDKNGNKIFEDDYLKFKVFGKDSEGYVDCYLGQFYIVDCGGYNDYNFLIYTDIEVIGTKFDKEVEE